MVGGWNDTWPQGALATVVRGRLVDVGALRRGSAIRAERADHRR